jgi:hypothetical protein
MGCLLGRIDAADSAKRHGRATPQPLVALEDEDVDACITCGKGCGQAAGSSADHGDRDAEIEFGGLVANDAHALRLTFDF